MTRRVRRRHVRFLLLVILSVVLMLNHFHIERGLDLDLKSRLPSSTSSGLGFVTTDGAWPKKPPLNENKPPADVKILGFTDIKYLPIAREWYYRLEDLGYTEHYIVVNDEKSLRQLELDGEDFRIIPSLIKDPEYAKPTKGLWQQLMSNRLKLTRDLLRNGTSVLITDVDNIWTRYVPLHGFIDEGYDIYHAYEMRYPEYLFDKYGFVVCSGHQFLRATEATIRFMDLVIKRCRSDKCDDQISYNEALFYDSDVAWDREPARENALRLSSKIKNNDQLLLEGATGRSRKTNHTIKIWDRDFAWRLIRDVPHRCPSLKNWVAMPTGLSAGAGDKIAMKLRAFYIWGEICGNQE